MTVVTDGGRYDGGRYLERPQSSGLADVVDLILDKGLVIDAFVRISVLGLELITIDARIVVASVDTYLRFAEAVDRVVLARPQNGKATDQLVGAVGGAERAVEGSAAGVVDKVKQAASELRG